MQAYDVLKLPQNATRAQVRKAYRKLVLIHHPDKGGSAAEFRRIQEAYEQIIGRVAEHRVSERVSSSPDSYSRRLDEFDWDN